MGFTTSLGHTPRFSISKDGDDITRRIADRVISIRVESRDGGGEADVCDIVVDDRGWDITLPSLGEGSATLSIALGYEESSLYAMGTYQVDQLEIQWPPKQLVLHGNSLGMTTNAKAPIITQYNGKTLGEILGSLAYSAGVTLAIDPALAGIQIPSWNQNASSMHQIQEFERKFNAMAKFSDGYLSFTQRGTGRSVSGQSIGSFALGPEDFGPSGNSIRLTNESAYDHVKVGWFDGVDQTTKYVTSTVPGSPHSSVPYLVKTIHPSEIEAQSVADSTMRQLNRRCKTGMIILAKGAPEVRGGQTFSVAGCRDGIDGSYVVSRAVHSLTKQAGLQTVIECYDEGGGADLPAGSTDGTLDFSSIPASRLPTTGIGHN